MLTHTSTWPNRATVAATARKTLGALPDAILAAALTAADRLQSAAIDALARAHVDRVDVLERLIGAPAIDLETVEHLAILELLGVRHAVVALTKADLVDDATAAFDQFDYARALERTEAFFWAFCDDHLELVKGRAYAGDPSAVGALRIALDIFQRLLAPPAARRDAVERHPADEAELGA